MKGVRTRCAVYRGVEARLLAVESGIQTELAEQLPRVADRLERLVGKTTGAKRLTDGLAMPLNVYEQPRQDGIKRTEEFEKKGLATYAVTAVMPTVLASSRGAWCDWTCEGVRGPPGGSEVS